MVKQRGTVTAQSVFVSGRFNGVAAIVLLCTLITTNDAGGRPLTAPMQNPIDSIIRSFMKQNAVPACSVGIGRGGALVYSKGYGRAGIKLPAGVDTVYRIGSLTKQFTAALLLMASEGRIAATGRQTLDTETSLATFFPDQKKWAGITLHHLLTHVSGMPSYTAAPNWRRQQFKTITAESLLKRAQGYRPDFSPGTRGHYSNTNYLLLAHVLELYTGRTYSDLLEDHIFRPLGMTHTRVISTAQPTGDQARGSVKGRFISRRTHPNWAFGVGDLQSSVADLARWNMALLGGRLMSHKSLELMFSSTRTNKDPAVKGEKLAMGWMDISKGGVKRFYHQGYLHGFSAINYVTDPLSGPKTFVTLLCNGNLISELPETALRIGKAF